jgi:rod shape-determining protein MreD
VDISSHWSPLKRQFWNWAVTIASVLLCLLLLPLRLPGMELMGLGPHWLLIWIVAWSLHRTSLQAILAGLLLGGLQDSLTAAQPTHALSLALVGWLTVRLHKQRFTQEDFISIALIVFAMAIVAETVVALQFSWQLSEQTGIRVSRALADIWSYHQQIALSSAILSSLWAPVLYYPLNRWWHWIGDLEHPLY